MRLCVLCCAQFQKRLQELRDRRGELVSELVRGVYIVKSYAFEERWGERVSIVRAAELNQLMVVRYLNAFISLICGLLSQATPFAIFAWSEPPNPASATLLRALFLSPSKSAPTSPFMPYRTALNLSMPLPFSSPFPRVPSSRLLMRRFKAPLRLCRQVRHRGGAPSRSSCRLLSSCVDLAAVLVSRALVESEQSASRSVSPLDSKEASRHRMACAASVR